MSLYASCTQDHRCRRVLAGFYSKLQSHVAAQWSSSMIPSSGLPGTGGGPGFNSRLSPFFFLFSSRVYPTLVLWCIEGWVEHEAERADGGT